MDIKKIIKDLIEVKKDILSSRIYDYRFSNDEGGGKKIVKDAVEEIEVLKKVLLELDIIFPECQQKLLKEPDRTDK